MLAEPQCFKRRCVNFIGPRDTKKISKMRSTVDGVVLVCKAFSKDDGGIPRVIGYGNNLHLRSFPKDNGIQFEKAKSEDAFQDRDVTDKKSIVVGEIKAPSVFILEHLKVREVLNELIDRKMFLLSTHVIRQGVNFNNIHKTWKNIFGTNINPKAVMAAYPTERIIKKLLSKRDITEVKQTFMLYSKNSLQYVVQAKEKEGNSIDPSLEDRHALRVERSFRIIDNKRIVSHNYFGLLDPFKDSNFGKEIMKRHLNLYLKTRLQTIELTADGYGSYAWARYGFEIKDNLKFEFFKSKLKVNLLMAGVNEDDVHKLIDEIRTMWELASVTFNGNKIGKKVLLDNNWNAFLNLTNRKQVSILNSYVNSVER